jgi:hypothetical protein
MQSQHSTQSRCLRTFSDGRGCRMLRKARPHCLMTVSAVHQELAGAVSYASAQGISELQLKAGLEELGIASKIETIKLPVTIRERPTYFARQIPVEIRGESPELAAAQGAAVEINTGKSQNQFPGSGTSVEHWPGWSDCLEITPYGVVRARLPSKYPSRDDVASSKHGIACRARRNELEPVFAAKHPWSNSVVRFISRHARRGRREFAGIDEIRRGKCFGT